MEGTQRELGTGFPDGLCGDDAHRVPTLGQCARGKVDTVALDADAALALAGEYRAYLHGLDTGILDAPGDAFFDGITRMADQCVAEGVIYIVQGGASQDPVVQRLHDILVVLQRAGGDTPERTAILFRDHHILCHIHQTAGQVTGIRRFQGGIRKTLARTVRGDEVFQYAQSILEIGQDRILDDLGTGGTALPWFGHQAPEAGELFHLLLGTTGAGIQHHEDGVETLPVRCHLPNQGLGHLGVHP